MLNFLLTKPNPRSTTSTACRPELTTATRCVPTTILSRARESTLARYGRYTPSAVFRFLLRTVDACRDVGKRRRVLVLALHMHMHMNRTSTTSNEQKARTRRGEIEQTWTLDLMTDFALYRARSTSAATARSSASRTASRSRCSCNERTPAALRGPFSTAASTARVSLRYAHGDI